MFYKASVLRDDMISLYVVNIFNKYSFLFIRYIFIKHKNNRRVIFIVGLTRTHAIKRIYPLFTGNAESIEKLLRKNNYMHFYTIWHRTNVY